MSDKPRKSRTLCQFRHGDVDRLGQSGIGWLAPLVAVAGLCMALAGAVGWPERAALIAPADEQPLGNTNVAPAHDASVPDSQPRDEVLVGYQPRNRSFEQLVR